MKLIKLTLHRSKRLHLLGGDTYTFDADDNMRYVVYEGVSGIGKSTILYNLSPLPPNMRDFYPDGYKEIILSHKGKTYTLKSQGTNAGKHSFLIDGVEHNISGSQTTQYELVKTHFNYTPTIHEYMLGLKRFTRLSSAERRELFMSLSNTDNTFINKLWDMVRAGQRDNTGALKNIQSKMAEQTANLVADEMVSEYAEELSTLKKDYGLLLQLRGRYEVQQEPAYNDGIVNKIVGLMDTHFNHAKQMYFGLLEKYAHISPFEIDDNIRIQNFHLSKLQEEKSKVLQQLEELHQQVHETNFNTETNPEVIRNKIQQHHATLNTIVQERPTIREDIKLLINYIGIDYLEAHAGMVVNQDLSDFSRIYADAVEVKVDDYRTLLQRIETLQNEVSVISGRIRMIDQAIADHTWHLDKLMKEPTHACPKCHHEFRANNTDEIIRMQQDNLDKLNKSKESRTETLQQYQTELIELQQKQKRLQLFYDYLTDKSGCFSRWFMIFYLLNIDASERPAEVLNHIEKYAGVVNEIQYLASIVKMYLVNEQELIHNETLLKSFELSTSKENIERLKNIELLEKVIMNNDEEQQKTNELLKQLGTAKTIVSNFDESVKQISRLTESLYRYQNNELVKSYHEVLDEAITTLGMRIDVLQKAIEHQSGIKYIIKHLQGNQTEVENAIATHTKLINKLNPKDGLIAKTQVGFIRHFIKEVNDIIDVIWTYPLVLRPDSAGLFMKDYKFPVFIGGKEGGSSKDVIETSTGQSEIIDFAFRITMMKYLGLTEWPIYADELGSSLNPTHRYRLYQFIKRCIDEHRCSQMYAVTHLSDISGIMFDGKRIKLSN